MKKKRKKERQIERKLFLNCFCLLFFLLLACVLFVGVTFFPTLFVLMLGCMLAGLFQLALNSRLSQLVYKLGHDMVFAALFVYQHQEYTHHAQFCSQQTPPMVAPAGFWLCALSTDTAICLLVIAVAVTVPCWS